MGNQPDTIIVGIGNLLMGDEGVGVHIVRRIEESAALPESVDVLDGGTGGFHLLGHFQRYDRVVLVDATMDGQPPGTITQLKPRFSTDYPQTLTAHDIGLKDLIDALYLLDDQPEIVLFAVSIADANALSVDLSEEIEAAVPGIESAVLGYVGGSS